MISQVEHAGLVTVDLAGPQDVEPAAEFYESNPHPYFAYRRERLSSLVLDGTLMLARRDGRIVAAGAYEVHRLRAGPPYVELIQGRVAKPGAGVYRALIGGRVLLASRRYATAAEICCEIDEVNVRARGIFESMGFIAFLPSAELYERSVGMLPPDKRPEALGYEFVWYRLPESAREDLIAGVSAAVRSPPSRGHGGNGGPRMEWGPVFRSMLRHDYCEFHGCGAGHEVADMRVRTAEDPDFPAIMSLAEGDPGVVRHTSYTYWMLSRMDPETVLVCEDGRSGVVGYLVGIYNFRDEESMLVQVVVADALKRTGVGTLLGLEFIRRSRVRGKKSLFFTIDPRNATSEGFLRSLANRADIKIESLGCTGDLGGTMTPENEWRITF